MKTGAKTMTKSAKTLQTGQRDHNHNHRRATTKRALGVAFALTTAVLLVEVVGGLFSHSLALLSDAGHVLTDIVALGLAWFAAAQAERPSDDRRTYGYHRVGILAALANAITLILIVVVIVVLVRHRPAPYVPVQSAPGAPSRSEALGILESRYARGEIQREEYLQKKQDLGG